MQKGLLQVKKWTNMFSLTAHFTKQKQVAHLVGEYENVLKKTTVKKKCSVFWVLKINFFSWEIALYRLTSVGIGNLYFSYSKKYGG